jgi:exodeoxyribonuclease VII small subunit
MTARAQCRGMDNHSSPTAPQNFEDALRQLETIVRELESGSVPLDDAIAKFEQGEMLRQYCQKRLDEAKARIEKIASVRDGVPQSTTPFDSEG